MTISLPRLPPPNPVPHHGHCTVPTDPTNINKPVIPPQGAIYGIDHVASRFGPEGVMALRPDVPGIPGLLLTGQDIFCCGFGGAMMSGLITSCAALRRNVYFDLQALLPLLAKSLLLPLLPGFAVDQAADQLEALPF